jgi:hypothetical protein
MGLAHQVAVGRWNGLSCGAELCLRSSQWNMAAAVHLQSGVQDALAMNTQATALPHRYAHTPACPRRTLF